jgi:arsenate reductase
MQVAGPETNMTVKIYHNPQCSNSRKALEIVRARGVSPEIVEYLKTPPTRAELAELVATMEVGARDIVRSKEPIYAELGLDGADDATLLGAMAANPILMNRPIVVTDKGARLCRPGEIVLEIL